MRLKDLAHKKVAIIGFGKEGQAMLHALEEHAIPASITICDKQTVAIKKPNVQVQTGANYLQNLKAFDVLIVSPGVPPCKELDAVGNKVTTSMQLVLEEAAAIGCTTIGVTGSKGKSTVSSLLCHICTVANVPAKLVGNIGVPGISALNTLTKDTILICELSSYQLHRMTVSPQIAVITSFFPDHLPYHAQASQIRTITNEKLKHMAALAEYLEAKCHITAFQTKADAVFYDSYTTNAAVIANRSSGKRTETSSEDAIIALSDTNLIGHHNLRNIGLVTTVCKYLGIKEQSIKAGCSTFTGLPHRLQLVPSNDGNTWVDDAISTTPESTMAALEALQNGVDVLIAGGEDRASNFNALAQAIIDSSIHTIVLFPDSGKKIKATILELNPAREIQFYEANSMREAIQLCKKATINKPNTQTILLSTASASYGLFTNFEEKGKQFAQHINEA